MPRGLVDYRGRVWTAHRLAWRLHYGPLTPQEHVLSLARFRGHPRCDGRVFDVWERQEAEAAAA
jgi:hypothetical protein